jgi:hypothetical protein
MTTNIFDGNTSVMATDSRWSIEYGQWLLYLDDTGYEKIERLNGRALMFAGRGLRIQEYKTWIRSQPADFSSMPEVKGMCVCMVDEATGTIIFQKHQEIEANGVLCAGSGARAAYSCWLLNKCARQAVESAKAKDPCSGGEVKYINFAKSETNIADVYPHSQLTINTISANIVQRGIAMKIQSTPYGTPNLPFSKAPSVLDAQEPPREEMAKLVANGTLEATAPCNGMHNDWTEQDKENFKNALAKMFGWNK